MWLISEFSVPKYIKVFVVPVMHKTNFCAFMVPERPPEVDDFFLSRKSEHFIFWDTLWLIYVIMVVCCGWCSVPFSGLRYFVVKCSAHPKCLRKIIKGHCTIHNIPR